MAEQQPSGGQATPNSVDPITAFWRDIWARSGATGAMPTMPSMAGMPNIPGMPTMPGMPAMPQFPGMPNMTDPAAMSAFLTPESLRRMQSAFYEAMAQYAEQYMRTPQFLESMKKSMDQAMQMRQQMDDFLKSNMATAFESATGGSNSEILGAIRHSTALLQAQIAKIDARVSDLEAAVSGKSKPTSNDAASAKKNTKR